MQLQEQWKQEVVVFWTSVVWRRASAVPSEHKASRLASGHMCNERLRGDRNYPQVVGLSS